MENIEQEIKNTDEEKRKHQKEFWNNFKSFIFLIVLCVACVLLTFAIVTFVKHTELIQKDPITFVMTSMNFTNCYCEMNEENVAICACIDRWGGEWATYGQTGFKKTTPRFSNMNVGLGDLGSLNITSKPI